MNALSDKTSEIYHQLCSVSTNFIAAFSSLFWFSDPQLYCFVSLSLLSWCHFQMRRAAVFTVHYQTADKVNKQAGEHTRMKHLPTTEAGISLRM